MKKVFQIIFFLAIFGLIITWMVVVKTNKKELLKNVEGKLIYFYGDGCPHCAKVEKFFKENSIEQKIQFEKREVYHNKENAKLLILITKKNCNFAGDEIGVPFLWDGEDSKCIVGDQSIIDYFKEKITSL
jgi:glutaredoxin